MGTPGADRFGNRQRGQVLPLTLVFIGAVILSLWVMYDSGQVATEKIKLQNTADNVAYSSAALVSRDLNFSAYTNRAMVANQVGIAQMVGLSSYSKFLEQTATNADDLATALQVIPGFGQAFKAITTALKQGAQVLSQGADILAAAIIPISDNLIDALSKAQDAYHSTALLAVGQVNDQVGQLNDPDAVSFFMVGSVAGLADAAQAYAQWSQHIGGQNELQSVSNSSSTAQAQNARFREFGRIVTDSRDPFSRERSYDWGFPFSGGLGIGPEIETRKYGGTELHRATTGDIYHWDWAGLDTAGLYTRICVPIFGCTSWADIVPVGWGAAHAVNDDHGGGDVFEYDEQPNTLGLEQAWGNGAWRNHFEASLAAGQYADHAVRHISRFQPFFRFTNDDVTHNYGPATIAVYLKNDNNISSQHTIIEGNGGTVADDLDTEAAGGLIDHRISASAKAQPYFARAADLDTFARRDRHYENGNLFNPFWQPRLVNFSAAEKTAISTAVASVP